MVFVSIMLHNVIKLQLAKYLCKKYLPMKILQIVIFTTIQAALIEQQQTLLIQQQIDLESAVSEL